MQIKEYILKNEDIEVHICNYGGIIKNIYTRDCNWKLVDIVLGFDDPEQYVSPDYLNNYPYLGTTIGRYANRIHRGEITLNGQIFSLEKNDRSNCLHGGSAGFDRQYWDGEQIDDHHLILRYTSNDGEGGFPGKLEVTVQYILVNNMLKITYDATTDRDTFVNITHRPYFNLNPEQETIAGLELQLYSNRLLETNPELIPTGNILTADTDHTFHFPKRLSDIIEKDGLDDCYLFPDLGSIQLMAELSSPYTGILLTILSDYPGLQVYTGKFLQVENGKQGKHYGPFSGIALEAQMFPDSPHHPSFPSTLLRPGEKYHHTTIYSLNCFSKEETDDIW